MPFFLDELRRYIHREREVREKAERQSAALQRGKGKHNSPFGPSFVIFDSSYCQDVNVYFISWLPHSFRVSVLRVKYYIKENWWRQENCRGEVYRFARRQMWLLQKTGRIDLSEIRVVLIKHEKLYSQTKIDENPLNLNWL